MEDVRSVLVGNESDGCWRTYFLNAAATPLPQLPFVLHASEEPISQEMGFRRVGCRTDEDAAGWGVENVTYALFYDCSLSRHCTQRDVELRAQCGSESHSGEVEDSRSRDMVFNSRFSPRWCRFSTLNFPTISSSQPSLQPCLQKRDELNF